jgi:hypothetical protein
VRKFSALAFAVMAATAALVFTGTQPASAKPTSAPSVACLRAKALNAASNKHMYLPPAVLTAAKYHCAHHLKAADTVKEPKSESSSRLSGVKPNGPCRMPAGNASSGSQLEQTQASCVAQWVTLARDVTDRPADCIKRDSAELQGKPHDQAFQQLDQSCTSQFTDRTYLPSLFGAGLALIGLAGVISYLLSKKSS